MSQHETQPNPNMAYVVVRPQKDPVFGLGLTAGILGIVSFPWAAITAARFVVDVLDTHYWIAILAVCFTVAAIAMLVLGIMAIVKNRQRDARLPMGLLGSAGLFVVASIVVVAINWMGTTFTVVNIMVVLPLIIVSLLAVLEAKKTAKHTAPEV